MKRFCSEIPIVAGFGTRCISLHHYIAGWWCNNHLENISQWEGLPHIYGK